MGEVRFTKVESEWKIHGPWIEAHFVTAHVSAICIIMIIVYAFYQYHKLGLLKSTTDKAIKYNILGTTLYWVFNLIACLIWSTITTDFYVRVIDHHTHACERMLGSAIGAYLISKFILQLILIFRLGVVYDVNMKYLRSLALLTGALFVFSLTMYIYHIDPHIALVESRNHKYHICALFHSTLGKHSFEIWPLIFGIKDFLIEFTTLGIFLWRFRLIYHASNKERNVVTVIRKLLVLQSFSILSTAVMYTFAVPFYPNLTLLLSVDAFVGSVCLLMTNKFSLPVYNVLCCGCDIVATYAIEEWTDLSTKAGKKSKKSKNSDKTAGSGSGKDDIISISTSPIKESTVGDRFFVWLEKRKKKKYRSTNASGNTPDTPGRGKTITQSKNVSTAKSIELSRNITMNETLNDITELHTRDVTELKPSNKDDVDETVVLEAIVENERSETPKPHEDEENPRIQQNHHYQSDEDEQDGI